MNIFLRCLKKYFGSHNSDVKNEVTKIERIKEALIVKPTLTFIDSTTDDATSGLTGRKYPRPHAHVQRTNHWGQTHVG